MNLVDVKTLSDLAAVEFADIVTSAHSPGTNQARIYLIDGSFIDIWYSLKLAGRYSYHWERRVLDGTIYRHDNAPHASWQFVATFPKHFHDGAELNLTYSPRINPEDSGVKQQQPRQRVLHCLAQEKMPLLVQQLCSLVRFKFYVVDFPP